MKELRSILIFTAYFAMIGYVCYLTNSGWPLLIMLVASPSIKDSDNDKTP